MALMHLNWHSGYACVFVKNMTMWRYFMCSKKRNMILCCRNTCLKPFAADMMIFSRTVPFLPSTIPSILKRDILDQHVVRCRIIWSITRTRRQVISSLSTAWHLILWCLVTQAGIKWPEGSMEGERLPWAAQRILRCGRFMSRASLLNVVVLIRDLPKSSC